MPTAPAKGSRRGVMEGAKCGVLIRHLQRRQFRNIFENMRNMNVLSVRRIEGAARGSPGGRNVWPVDTHSFENDETQLFQKNIVFFNCYKYLEARCRQRGSLGEAQIHRVI